MPIGRTQAEGLHIFLGIVFKENERYLHLKVNELQHFQIQNPSAANPTQLATATAQLKERLTEQNYYASKHKSTINLVNTERCFKFSFGRPNTPQDTDSPKTWSQLVPKFRPFDQEYTARLQNSLVMGDPNGSIPILPEFFRTLRHISSQRARLTSTALKFYRALTYTAI
ncbi:uncharacterized protein PHALS_06716 [Plasmopara halstedii]|uniref:Uncharacterized protein n=1 Tax=Plasmopara halstedii TaxID=4781 RepID=A0A0P1B3R6_PLAHL|nr:uncharacterized protein PHALS_06716 [Plasmopara halstedii]CEG48924.1 hypothetical protein PHALS_06716 [Plasmopara halstedii]|eukprot:XP_024585293.1 hypothetical protein PHALS_06716 [Plasmopara halstedii]